MTVNDISLKLEQRTVKGKKVAALRTLGLVPSVIYGGKAEPMLVQSSQIETTKVVHAAGKHSPVHLTIDGKKKLAIIKTVDKDPVRHLVRHVAFHTIKQNEIITTEVPLVLVGQGESAAEKAGLVVLQALEKVEIKAKPADLPESFELSIKELATTEDKITLGDIKLPEGVEFADFEQDIDLVIANVYEPSALQAANEAAGGDIKDESEVLVDAASDEQPEVKSEGKSASAK
jgi:large subunit ribosomal protein L25